MRYILIAIALVALVLALFVPIVVSAHERRTIAGKYDVEVGWDQEPTIANQTNAAAIAIYKAGTETPIAGVQKTLRVKVAFGGNKPKEFPLEAVWGKSGYYIAKIIPTRPGGYVFTFVGDIEGTPVNETFESGPGRFEDVKSSDDLYFPQSPNASFVNDLKAAYNEISTTRFLAIAGLVVGVLGLLVGSVALALRRRG